jgi:hypothetical protein
LAGGREGEVLARRNGYDQEGESLLSRTGSQEALWLEAWRGKALRGRCKTSLMLTSAHFRFVLLSFVQLLERNPKKRMGWRADGTGINDIKTHPWLRDLDWNALEKKTATPVFIPDVRPCSSPFLRPLSFFISGTFSSLHFRTDPFVWLIMIGDRRPRKPTLTRRTSWKSCCSKRTRSRRGRERRVRIWRTSVRI